MKLTYSHKRTCDHRAGITPLPFYRSRLHTPRSVDGQTQELKKLNNPHSCLCQVAAVLLDTLVLDCTCSLQMRHFLTRGEQREQVAMCPQGPKRVSLFMSEHTIHSSSDSMLLFRDGLRVPTWPLEQKTECVSEREQRLQARGWKKRKMRK